MRKAVFCNIWRRKILFAKEKEKKENIMRSKIYFAEDKKNRRERIWKIFGEGTYIFCRGEGKGAKYLENGNIFLRRRKNGDRTEVILVTASIAGSSVKFWKVPPI